jgi:DNA-binding SARP family transcriptional activator
VPEFLLLGPFEVRDAGEVVPIHRQKQRALAAALALRPGRPVSADRLVDDLWGDRPPRKAKDALQNYVSQLRKLLGSDLLTTQPAGYALEIAPEQVDIFQFQGLVTEARDAPSAERGERLREALALVRGAPLADLALEPFAVPEAARLEELELATREELVEVELELGRHAELVSELEALIARHPFRERLRGQLMLALYRSGRQADALEAYREARSVLVDELGIEPGEELQQLEAAILRQDEALRAPPRQERHVTKRAEPSRPRAARKTVTVVFAATVQSEEDADPEARHALLERQAARARAAVERHGGRLERALGEELVAVFGLPTVHEDDALRAVRAAVELRDVLSEQAAVRAGVSTGEVFVAGDDEATATGPAVAAAEQLEQAATPGEIVISGTTRWLVGEGLIAEELPEQIAFRIVELVPESFSRRLRLDSPLVGRTRQLAALMGAYEAAVADRTCHLFTVLGPAGVGKSRLAREFTGELSTANVLHSRCPPYGEGVTYRPLLELAEEAATVPDAPSHMAQTVRRIQAEGSVDDLRAAAVSLLTEAAGARPLIVVLDDLHWAEQALLDLVEHLAGTARDVPLLLLCLARPELLEERPSWAGGKANTTTLLLEPLTDDESALLLDNLLGESDLPEPVRAHIVGGAEGNPLFVEELLELLVERDVLRREGGRWTTTQLAVPRIPPSIRALIAARLDRLPADEQIALEAASIEGVVFHREAVTALLPSEVELDVLLAALVRKELLRPVAAGEAAHRFRHQLIREAAYEAMPKRRRAGLHQTFAEWLERQPSAADADEVIGYHLERACSCLRELGESDETTRALAHDAAERLRAAAERASARGDVRRAEKLRARAAALTAD